MKALESEISKIKVEFTPEKERLEKDRIITYCSYFALLRSEKTQMEKLYKPLQESLSAGTDTDKKLVFEAQINYRLDQHYKSGLNIIDRTRKGNFRESDSLKKALNYLGSACKQNNFDDKTLEIQLKKVLDFLLFAKMATF